MKEIILDTLLDAVRLIPFLFIAFLIIELIEHKLNEKSVKSINKSGKLGPLYGSLLGLLPQCGFSVLATNLYITRIISLGTLISVYLATSDEMLPIMISSKADIKIILLILGIKIIVGIIAGFLIDFLLRNREDKKDHLHDLCKEDNCHCEEENPFKSAIIHTLKTIIFITFVTFILNIMMNTVGKTFLTGFLKKGRYLAPFISALIGLIPNCGASIIITELYLKGIINLGTCLAGLLTGSGVAILVLFKSNKNLKENLYITYTLYAIGVIVGLLIEIISRFM